MLFFFFAQVPIQQWIAGFGTGSTVGDHPQAAEAFVGPHVFDQFVFLLFPENELPVHDPRNAVVIRDREESRGFEASQAHGRRVEG